VRPHRELKGTIGMADTITYFGDPIRATYPNGGPIIVNGQPLLIPPNFNLQTEINAAHYAATRPFPFLDLWFLSTTPMAAVATRNDKQATLGALIRDMPMQETMRSV
jgi:hypothetical protein